MATRIRAYSEKMYSEEQRSWCRWYEHVTTFEPVMSEYEAGGETFEQAVQWNLRWFEDWAHETRDFLLRGPPSK